MLKKILIANRGEIAVRVIRAARELGIKTVAVYSELDRDALHVRLADEAYALGGTTSAETYLSIDKILSVARRSGADAVHPGYGFLAENAPFARACEEAGVTFIGPPADAIDAMGSKTAARALMDAAGVPIVPGVTEGVADVAEATGIAEGIGYPVAVKAAAGGGGKGFRVALTPDDLEGAFEGARRESEKFFADGEDGEPLGIVAQIQLEGAHAAALAADLQRDLLAAGLHHAGLQRLVAGTRGAPRLVGEEILGDRGQMADGHHARPAGLRRLHLVLALRDVHQAGLDDVGQRGGLLARHVVDGLVEVTVEDVPLQALDEAVLVDGRGAEQHPFDVPDDADAWTYFHVFTPLGHDHCGVYVDRFTKHGERWLISHRRIKIDWVHPGSLVIAPQDMPKR